MTTAPVLRTPERIPPFPDDAAEGDWDPLYLDIDERPRYLHRYVYVDDTPYEPAPDVRTLWELNPEIGADACVTDAMTFGCTGLENNSHRSCENVEGPCFTSLYPCRRPLGRCRY